MRGPDRGAGSIRRAGPLPAHAAAAVSALPLARLGVRHPHRPILVRSGFGQGAAVQGVGRAGRDAGQGSLCRRNLRGRRRGELSGDRFDGAGCTVGWAKRGPNRGIATRTVQRRAHAVRTLDSTAWARRTRVLALLQRHVRRLCPPYAWPASLESMPRWMPIFLSALSYLPPGL